MAENRKGVFGLLKSLLSRSGDLYGSVYLKRFGPVRMITIGTAAGKDAGTLPAKDLPIDIVGAYGKVYNGSTYVDCVVSIDKTTGKVTITDLYGGTINGMQVGYLWPRSITYLANWGGYGLTSLLLSLSERWWKHEDNTDTLTGNAGRAHKNRRVWMDCVGWLFCRLESDSTCEPDERIHRNGAVRLHIQSLAGDDLGILDRSAICGNTTLRGDEYLDAHAKASHIWSINKRLRTLCEKRPCIAEALPEGGVAA